MKKAYVGDIKSLRDPLLPLIYDLVLYDKSRLCNTHVHSKDGRCLHRRPEFKDVYSFVLNTAKEYGIQNGLNVEEITTVMSWINVYPPGTYINRHKHYRNLFTSVFYLQSNDASGQLYVSGDPNPKNIKEGEMYIFPSDIEHWSSPNESYQDRIVFGCDFCFYHIDDETVDRILSNWLDHKKT